MNAHKCFSFTYTRTHAEPTKQINKQTKSNDLKERERERNAALHMNYFGCDSPKGRIERD